MPNNNATLDPALLRTILPQLLQNIDLSSLLSLLKSKVPLTPDYYVGKTVKQLSTMRDQRLRTANMLDYAINFLENTDFSKFSPLNKENFAKPKINLSAEEVLDKTIEFLTTLKDYTANKPDLKEAFSNIFKNSNITETIKNNLSKNGSNFNLEDYTNKLTEILQKLIDANKNNWPWTIDN